MPGWVVAMAGACGVESAGTSFREGQDWYGIRTDNLARIVGDGGTADHAMGVIGWEGTNLPTLTSKPFTFESDNISDVSLRRDYQVSGTYSIPANWTVGFVENEDDASSGRDPSRAELYVPSAATLSLGSGTVLKSASVSQKEGSWYGVRTESLSSISSSGTTIKHAGGAVSLESSAASSMPDIDAAPFTSLTLADNASDICFDRDLEVAASTTLEIEPGWRLGFTANRDEGSSGWNAALSELIVRGVVAAGDTASSPIVITSNLHIDLAADSLAWEGIHFLGEFEAATEAYGWALGTDSYIENAEIKSARHHLSVDSLCAPSLHDVTFVGDGDPVQSPAGHIYLNSTDVVVPFLDPVYHPHGGWTLNEGTYVVATSSTSGSSYEYNVSPRGAIGETGKVDLIVQGPMLVNGTPSNRVHFRSDATDATNADEWGGVFFDFFSAGSSAYGASFRFAPNPVYILQASGITLRQSVVRNFRDVGIWIDEAKGVEIDSCTVVREKVSVDYGTTGVLASETSDLTITDNSVKMTQQLGVYGGSGIRLAASNAFCQQSGSPADVISVSGNTVIGSLAAFGDNWSGISLFKMCAVGNNDLEILDNTVTDWTKAGFVFESTGDADVECNNVRGNRHALESWGGKPSGASAVSIRENLLYAYYVGSEIEVVESDDFTGLSGSEGSNTFVIAVLPAHTGSGEFVRNENGSDSSALPAHGSTWLEVDAAADTVIITYDDSGDVVARCDLAASSLSIGSILESCGSCDCPEGGGGGTGGGALAQGPREVVALDRGEILRVGVDVPERTGIRGVGPNPFRSAIFVEFGIGLDQVGSFRADVFDVSGRRVRHLAEGDADPGLYRALWDGRTGGGNPVAAGVYFLRVQIGSSVEVRKVVRLQ